MNEFNPIIIGDVEKFSVVDFPNQIAAVVFLQGCPWRCPFCYNISLQKIGAEPETEWTFDILKSFLKRRKPVLDAVVFSGGEPLVHDGLSVAVDEVRQLGYKVGLHTGGYRPENLKKIIDKVDWVGLDIKAPLRSEKYKIATGGYSLVENIKESLAILLQSQKKFECRTTCDPRILSVEDIREIASFLIQQGVREYYLQKYRPTENDKTTTDEACEMLINNEALNTFLKEKFEIFDIRK